MNDKLDEMRKSLAGGEFARLLENVGNAPDRDYDRNMRKMKVQRLQKKPSVYEQAQNEFAVFAKREAKILAGDDSSGSEGGREEGRNGERIGARAAGVAGASGPGTGQPKLTDKTKIGGKTWAELKKAAMKADYQNQAWFVSIVFLFSINDTFKDHLVLRALRSADELHAQI